MDKNGINPTMNQMGMNQFCMNQMCMNSMCNNEMNFNPLLMRWMNPMGMNLQCSPYLKPMKLPKTIGGEFKTPDIYEVVHNSPKSMLNQIFDDGFELKTKEESLTYFFGFISLTNNNDKLDTNGEKLIVNYYDIIKTPIYLDLSLDIQELVKIIYWKIFYPSFRKTVTKRTQKNQSLEYIMNNPIIEMDDDESPIKYTNFLTIEFQHKDLSLLKGTGKEIGLKKDSEIFLKIKQDLYKELTQFPKEPINVIINNSIKGKNYLKQFFINKNGISSSLFSILFNTPNYRLQTGNGCYLDTVPKILGFEEITVERRVIGGAGPINFADVSSGQIKELKFSENAPKWRLVNKGLNIFGICPNDQCEAYKKEVIYKTDLPNRGLMFNLNEQVINIRCPICNKIIKCKTCGFYDCEYQFVGKKIDKGDVVEFDSKTRETKGNKFDYFDPFENGEVLWIELIIYVSPKQNIKQQTD